MLTKKLQLRGADDWGDGSYKAPRGTHKSGAKKGQPKFHKGIDYLADAGDEIVAPISGAVTKLGYPYAPDPKASITYRYVEITDYAGRRHRLFYVDPVVYLNQHVNQGTVIGLQQDIACKFHHPKRQPMKNHTHYEILDLDGNPINPERGVT